MEAAMLHAAGNALLIILDPFPLLFPQIRESNSQQRLVFNIFLGGVS